MKWCVWKCYSKNSYMARHLQKTFASVCGPLVTKKPGTESKTARHLMGITFISQLTATPSCKEVSSWTAESSHTGPHGTWTLQRLSAPAFCVQDVGPDMGPSTNKQTYRQTFNYFGLTLFWCFLSSPLSRRRRRRSRSPPSPPLSFASSSWPGLPKCAQEKRPFFTNVQKSWEMKWRTKKVFLKLDKCWALLKTCFSGGTRSLVRQRSKEKYLCQPGIGLVCCYAASRSSSSC